MSFYRPLQIGPLRVPGNLFLAPVAGYTDRAFRSICVEEGADFSFTELVSSEALTRNPRRYGFGAPDRPGPDHPGSEWPPAAAILRRAPNEGRYAIQLFGAEPEVMYRAALLLAPFRPEAVDLNAGCPVPKVVKTGAGSALMRDPVRLGRIVEALVRASREGLGGVPVTVKLRSGWDAASINYAQCARIAVEAGAAMLSLHPRTRAQGYGGKSDWSQIADLVPRLAVPVTGSGDLFSPEDAERMFRETGCAAVMFARGAQGNPFIFSAARSLLETGAYRPPEAARRIEAGLRQLELLAADLGERAACREMRKQFAAYTKGCFGAPGIPGGAALRERLVRAASIAEYRAILDPFLECVKTTQPFSQNDTDG
jgi:nifR3 family TIM-barrel protein